MSNLIPNSFNTNLSNTLLGTLLLVLTYLLLGEDSGDYVISVVTNVSLFVSAVTPQAIVGVAIVVGVLAYLRSK